MEPIGNAREWHTAPGDQEAGEARFRRNRLLRARLARSLTEADDEVVSYLVTQRARASPIKRGQRTTNGKQGDAGRLGHRRDRAEQPDAGVVASR